MDHRASLCRLKLHDFDIKFITPLRWKHAGGERQFSLLIVRPIACRLRKGAQFSYRNPAYLICGDPAVRTTATPPPWAYKIKTASSHGTNA